MTRLDRWLEQATRYLSKDSATQVRTEIQEHYDAAREDAMSSGATSDTAEQLAITALGDAEIANRQYRCVLLTSAEERLLRDAKWEARIVCAHPGRKWQMLAIPVIALFAAAALFLAGEGAIARILLGAGIIVSPLFAALFLPVYTPLRGRIFRCVKWVFLVAGLGLAFGPDALKWSWLLISCLWPSAWIEWMRVSIRRKLPVAQWPKSLYL